jgi:S-adenosylmethionine:tRNA ribosyltransferase-isomerase
MNTNRFSLSDYQFDLPKELIAQYPVEPRDSARLLIVHRSTGCIDEGVITDLPSLLSPNDALVFNDTRVIHARLHGTVDGKRAFHCLLTKQINLYEWWVLAKPARILAIGARLIFEQSVTGEVKEISSDGQRLIVFSEELSPQKLQAIGTIPLPPYIQRPATNEIDASRYQTIYGSHYGSVAAPTAGLHFTQRVFSNLKEKKISTHFVTLHVGTGTFLPIRVPDIRMHQMHTETFEVADDTAMALNSLPCTSRKVAVGTTSCRVLETAAQEDGAIVSGESATNLFIYPGYRFKYVSSLFTNFHTPESSLLVLVSAFMGNELMKEAYQKAIERKFRFFSYGDAMLIL